MLGAPAFGRLFVAFPFMEYVMAYPYSKLRFVHRAMQSVHWDAQVVELVLRSRVYPTQPLFLSNLPPPRLRDAVETLEGERKAHQQAVSRLSGREFEKFVAEVFSASGFAVQQNLHLLGAEVDLLLLEFSHEGDVRYSVVECKHRARSRELVGIGDVIRLFGLSEALRAKGAAIAHSILVTTNGFSAAAKNFAHIYDLGLLNFEALLDWVTNLPQREEDPIAPLFKIQSLDATGRFYLDQTLALLAGIDNSTRVYFIGAGEYFELWSHDRWEAETRAFRESDWGQPAINV